jgi:diguanylate cyclase (GGDEF)-like protein
LVFLAGERIGQRVELGEGELSVGRAPECDMALASDLVSRSHATFAVRGNSVTLRDHQSTNGTYVNDRPIRESELGDGDRISIGEFVLKYLAPGNAEAGYHDAVFRLMTHDGLTDVFNKRYFEEQLGMALVDSQQSLSVILFDADHFKQINDSWGHPAGDSVLRQLAECAKSVTNAWPECKLARIGGEEFAVLVPLPLARAVVLAEELRQSVKVQTFQFDGRHLNVSISLGVAMRSLGDTPTQLYQRADAQLYRAKQSGRDRVCS